MVAKTVEIIPGDERSEVIWEYVEGELTAAEAETVFFNGNEIGAEENQIFIDAHGFDIDLLSVEVEQGDGNSDEPDTVHVEFTYPSE